MKKIRPHQRLKGGVLIEALVAILILSFGMLGMAGLQLSAASYQKNSWSLHRLSELTTDIAEKIRSNPLGANLGLYSYGQKYDDGKVATFTLNGCKAVGTSCAVDKLASDDVAQWVTKSQNLLPQGSVLLQGNAREGFIATAMWFEKESTESPNICTGTEANIDWRNCCPPAADVTGKTGVRCYRARFQL
jgi:type IV pilus assembly protein PilV